LDHPQLFDVFRVEGVGAATTFKVRVLLKDLAQLAFGQSEHLGGLGNAQDWLMGRSPVWKIWWHGRISSLWDREESWIQPGDRTSRWGSTIASRI